MSFTMQRFMSISLVLFLVAALGVSSYLPVRAQDVSPYQIDAHAVLMDGSARQVGTIRFLDEQAYGTIAVMIQVNNMTPGFHAIHIATVGQCDVNADPPFSTAGEPLNLQGQDFPFRSSDMPPILVMENGTGAMTFRTDRFTMGDLMDGDGSAVVVEAGAQDFGITVQPGEMAAPEGGPDVEEAAEDVTPTPPAEGAAEGETEGEAELEAGAEGEQETDDAAEGEAEGEEALQVTPTPMEGAEEGEGETEGAEEMQVTATPTAAAAEGETAGEQPTELGAGEFVACGVLTAGDVPAPTAEPTEETEGEEVEEEVDEAAEDVEDAAEEGAAALEGAETVEVILTEYEIDMPTTVSAGTVTFEITNNGNEEHNFEIEGEGGFEESLDENLQPGEAATLVVELQPGTYTVYCPVADHEDMGMQLTLNVTESEE